MVQDHLPDGGLDDATVARLLADDARASSARYAAQGLSALLPKRMNTGAPKPNTKFLKNLVRDADSHNAALKRREELEKRDRLRKIEDEARRRSHEEGRARKRQRASEHGQEGRRRDHERLSDEKHHRSKRRSRNTSSDSSRSRSPRRSKDRRAHRDGSKERRHRRRSYERHEDERRIREHRKHKRRRSTSRSPSRNKTPSNSSLLQPSPKHSPPPRSPSPTPSHNSSDPLESIVGPLPVRKPSSPPPVRRRGRGAFKSSAMDAHFASSYDPDLDVRPDSDLSDDDREDWDMALEALRDRQQWKKKHADRLREAGFNDRDIKKWEDSGREKGIEDVRWSKKGEEREWDVGKVDLDEAPATTGTTERKTKRGVEQDGWKRKDSGLLKGLRAALH